MAKIFPIRPARPELICWGCDRYCSVNDMACGNGADRTQHPVELFGEGWESFGLDAAVSAGPAQDAAADAAKPVSGTGDRD